MRSHAFRPTPRCRKSPSPSHAADRGRSGPLDQLSPACPSAPTRLRRWGHHAERYPRLSLQSDLLPCCRCDRRHFLLYRRRHDAPWMRRKQVRSPLVEPWHVCSGTPLNRAQCPNTEIRALRPKGHRHFRDRTRQRKDLPACLWKPSTSSYAPCKRNSGAFDVGGGEASCQAPPGRPSAPACSCRRGHYSDEVGARRRDPFRRSRYDRQHLRQLGRCPRPRRLENLAHDDHRKQARILVAAPWSVRSGIPQLCSERPNRDNREFHPIGRRHFQDRMRQRNDLPGLP
mmetsp:Transcript_51063/g.148643  ORF Transcript_51063/g.148643 Transcript_51063/m.148643 type:complete len:286 (-) Transcript_51063:596-1453(-)